MKFWVLTEEYNLYDQQGAYFLGVWSYKPSLEEMTQKIDGNIRDADHILKGGGRRGYEQQWYNFCEMEEG